MALFSQYSSPDQSRSALLKGAAELSLCELDMGIAEPSAAFDTLWEYADALAQEQEYPTLIDCAERMCELSRRHSLARQEAVSLIKLGAAHERMGDPDRARECYARSIRLSRSLYDAAVTETSRDDLAVASFRLGFIEYISKGDARLVTEAAELWRGLYGDTGNYEYRRRAGAAENLLATPVEPTAQAAEQTASEDTAPSETSAGKRRLTAIIVAAALTAAVVIELVLIISALGTL